MRQVSTKNIPQLEARFYGVYIEDRGKTGGRFFCLASVNAPLLGNASHGGIRSIAGDAAPEDRIMAHGIASLPESVSEIAFHRVNLGWTALGPGGALVVQIKEDDHAGRSLRVARCPPSSALEPTGALVAPKQTWE